MFDLDFWGEPISVYTDSDGIEDGILIDISELKVLFNGRIINRVACEAAILLKVKETEAEDLRETLQFIAVNCTFDGEGFDAWGIFQNQFSFGGEKLWLVSNEVDGYTLMLPSEY